MYQATKNMPSMTDLLTKVGNQNDLKIGDKVMGNIIFVAKNQALIDVPNVGLGVVRGRELYNEEFLAKLKVGEEIEAVVLELDNEIGIMELSFREIGKDKIWQDIQASYEEKSIIECKIREANRGGFLVKVKGLDGFLPASLLSPTHAIKNVSVEDNSLLNQMKKYVGQTFNVKIISINSDNESLIVSEKAVSDEIANIKLQKYKLGDIIEGNVVGVVDFGVFIRFDEDLEGLIHISEIAWKKVEDPRKDFKINQKVQAKIVDIDDNNRINLSIKQLLENPWIQFSKSAKPSDKFVGTVSKIVSYGAIVVNEDDIQGLCHISQITEGEINNPSEIHNYLKIGEKRDFQVLSLETDEKLYLTMIDFDTAIQRQNQILEQIEEHKKNHNQNHNHNNSDSNNNSKNTKTEAK
jgi:small subunit ribosomal protein S1